MLALAVCISCQMQWSYSSNLEKQDMDFSLYSYT